MRAVSIRALTVGTALAVAGCALDAGDSAPPPSVSGWWSGTWTSSEGAGGEARAGVIQEGPAVRGWLELDDDPCFGMGTFDAVLFGGELDGVVRVGEHTVDVFARRRGGLLAGEWVVGTRGPCAGARGAITLESR